MTGSGVPRIWGTRTDVLYSKEFELDVDDHLQTKFARITPVRRAYYIVAMGFVGIFCGLVYSYDWYRAGEAGHFLLGVAVGLLLGLAAGWLSYGFAAGAVRGFWRGFLNEREAVGVKVLAEADPRGITMVLRGQTWHSDWHSFHAIEEDDRLFYFWLSRYHAQVWPKRSLTDDEVAAFRDSIAEWTGEPPVSPPRLAGNVKPQY